jgi:hypothetical protein
LAEVYNSHKQILSRLETRVGTANIQVKSEILHNYQTTKDILIIWIFDNYMQQKATNFIFFFPLLDGVIGTKKFLLLCHMIVIVNSWFMAYHPWQSFA